MIMRMAGLTAVCAALALAGCGGGNNEAAGAGGSTTTSTTTTTAPAATAPAATTTTASTGAALPAACEAYVTRVQACADRMGASNPMAATVRQTMEQTRASWSAIPDQTALANACTQADAQWTQSSAAMGC